MEIIEITLGTPCEPLTLDVKPEKSESVGQSKEEGNFICSSAISVHMNVDLQDVDITEDIRFKFHELRSKY